MGICILSLAGFDKTSCHVQEGYTEGADEGVYPTTK